MSEIKAIPTPQAERFLIETLLYHQGFRFLEEHLNRMRTAARHFGIPFNEASIRAGLSRLGPESFGDKPFKVRITADFNGGINVASTLLQQEPAAERVVAISPHRVNSADEHLYFKTSERTLYESEYARIANEGLYEVLFLNEEGALTEGSRSNVILQRGASLITPPVSAGLLNGIYRQQLLLQCDTLYEEMLYPKDLHEADAVYICNSVRGLQKVTLKQLLKTG